MADKETVSKADLERAKENEQTQLRLDAERDAKQGKAKDDQEPKVEVNEVTDNILKRYGVTNTATQDELEKGDKSTDKVSKESEKVSKESDGKTAVKED